MPEILKRDAKVPEPPRAAEVVVEPSGFYVHHAVIGAAIIAGGVLAGVVAPAIKPVTRGAIIVASVALGSFLIWDDITAHLESGCPMDTVWSFVPCSEKVTVVKKAGI